MSVFCLEQTKFILDATASFRCIWENKAHPNVIYLDIRSDKQLAEDHESLEKYEFYAKGWNPEIPTTEGDFRKLHYPDNSFKLIVFDPPFKNFGRFTFTKKYGCLNNDQLDTLIGAGFKELWRVLQPYGILIFKWNNSVHSIEKVSKLFPAEPLFSQISKAGKECPYGKKCSVDKLKKRTSQTYWFTFMKIPKELR